MDDYEELLNEEEASDSDFDDSLYSGYSLFNFLFFFLTSLSDIFQERHSFLCFFS